MVGIEYIGKNNRWAILGLILILLIGGTIWKFQRDKISDLNDKNLTDTNLRKSLNDTVDYYLNKEQDWVAEKLTIQYRIDDLEEINNELTADQKRLISKVKEIQKENSVISAALVKAKFIIDSLINDSGLVDTLNNTIEFTDANDNIKYKFKIFSVRPYPLDSKPRLLIDELSLPNEQFIEFHWKDEKKEGYPISFSVTNTNEYFKIVDINSYAIPELIKEEIDPTTWGKITDWFKGNGKLAGCVVGGIVVGSAGTLMLIL